MSKSTASIYTLVYVEDGKPVTLEFQDLESLSRHVRTERIEPTDDEYTLLVDGKETEWELHFSVRLIINEPLDAVPKTKKPRTRRTKEQIEAARLAGEKVPGRKPKANGALATVDNAAV